MTRPWLKFDCKRGAKRRFPSVMLVKNTFIHFTPESPALTRRSSSVPPAFGPAAGPAGPDEKPQDDDTASTATPPSSCASPRTGGLSPALSFSLPPAEEEAPRRGKSAKAQVKKALQQRLYRVVAASVEKRVANMVVNRVIAAGGAGGWEPLEAAVARAEAGDAAELQVAVARALEELAAAGRLARGPRSSKKK
mmetsp:Transcript_11324/g.27132  ORF Transcript_11324/g.27132 Transcript_11324/m.27132 type:complete len:194 (-) Transcript_11324:240-821(-)